MFAYKSLNGKQNSCEDRESVLTFIQCRYDQYIIIFRIQSFLMAINKP